MRIGICGAAALFFVLASSVASARDIPAAGLTVEDVVSWLQGVGYPAQIVTANNGTRHVDSTVLGLKFSVYLDDCNGDHCGSIQFAAGFATHGSFNTARLNEWNRNNRWARGFYDDVNDPWIEMDCDMTPGGTYELLNDELATWKKVVDKFTSMYSLK